MTELSGGAVLLMTSGTHYRIFYTTVNVMDRLPTLLLITIIIVNISLQNSGAIAAAEDVHQPPGKKLDRKPAELFLREVAAACEENYDKIRTWSGSYFVKDRVIIASFPSSLGIKAKGPFWQESQ